jgi:hypothetical protein
VMQLCTHSPSQNFGLEMKGPLLRYVRTDEATRGLAISWTTEATVALAGTALAFLFGIPSR